MPRRRRKVKSQTRGGASAPERCKKGLRECMVDTIREGRAFKTASGICMRAFNKCRLGRRKKAASAKGRCLKWAKKGRGKRRCLRRAA